MWSVSDVALRDGVSKQAVSKKVKALAEKHGLSVERNAQGHVVRLNVAEYDHLRGRFDDPSKDQRPEAPSPKRGGSASRDHAESYDEALRQKTWHEAEKRRLELAELKGELIPVAAVADAVIACHEAISRVIDRLPSFTDDLAAAVAKDGAHGLRVELRKVAVRMRGDVADALESLASTSAPKKDVAA